MNLSCSKLSPGQAKSLLTQVAEASSLRRLKLSENDLSTVPGNSVGTVEYKIMCITAANILAKAINAMNEVELSKCSLTIYQVIFEF